MEREASLRMQQSTNYTFFMLLPPFAQKFFFRYIFSSIAYFLRFFKGAVPPKVSTNISHNPLRNRPSFLSYFIRLPKATNAPWSDFLHQKSPPNLIGELRLSYGFTHGDVFLRIRFSASDSLASYKSAWLKYRNVPAFPAQSASPHRFRLSAPQRNAAEYAV